jgi:hypothetical protein
MGVGLREFWPRHASYNVQKGQVKLSDPLRGKLGGFFCLVVAIIFLIVPAVQWTHYSLFPQTPPPDLLFILMAVFGVLLLWLSVRVFVQPPQWIILDARRRLLVEDTFALRAQSLQTPMHTPFEELSRLMFWLEKGQFSDESDDWCLQLITSQNREIPLFANTRQQSAQRLLAWLQQEMPQLVVQDSHFPRK